MFKINKNVISITRGDVGTISLKIPMGNNTFYQFQPNDVITFSVYAVNGLSNNALILKNVTVLETNDTVEIPLSTNDTTIGNLTNTPLYYWYEIQLNSNQTILGYDNLGPKLFILYPEGSDII